MATGALDANGIWQYGEDDSEATFSALLNKLGASVSTQTGKRKVLQVVSFSYATGATNSTTTYADTGLTATITPSSTTSKILVLVSQNGLYKTAGASTNGVHLRLLRGATEIQMFGYSIGYDGVAIARYLGGTSAMFLDSPATTSAVTYKTQLRNEANAASVSVQFGGAQSTITLIEVSA